MSTPDATVTTPVTSTTADANGTPGTRTAASAPAAATSPAYDHAMKRAWYSSQLSRGHRVSAGTAPAQSVPRLIRANTWNGPNRPVRPLSRKDVPLTTTIAHR